MQLVQISPCHLLQMEKNWGKNCATETPTPSEQQPVPEDTGFLTGLSAAE